MASISQLTARLIDLFGSPATANPSKLLNNLGVSSNGNVIVGAATSTDNGTDKLQVTGTTKFNTNGGQFQINGAAAQYKLIYTQSGGVARWSYGSDNSTETGSNAGSNYMLNRYTDAGAFIDTPLSINRSSGWATWPNTVAYTNAGVGIQLNNATFINALDSGGVTRNLIHMSADNHPSIVNGAGSYIRFVNQAYNAELMRCDNSGNMWLNGTLNCGAITGSSLTSGASINTGSGAYQYNAYTTTAIGATGAFHVANDIGTSYANWCNTATVAVQMDAPNAAAAYYGTRWTRWGARHIATISGYEGGSGSSSCVIAFLLNSSSGPLFQFYDTGSATFNGALTQNSDYRIKTNVQTIEPRTAMNQVLSLRPVTYDRSDEAAEGETHVGFIAHEIQEVFPLLVTGEKDATKIEKQLIGDKTPHRPGEEPEGYVAPVEQDVVVPDLQSVNYIGMVPYLVAAMQEMKRELDEMKAELATLKANNNG
jgi:hypothetical protein